MAISDSIFVPTTVETEWQALLERTYREAYAAGVIAGSERMRQAILNVAQAPAPISLSASATSTSSAIATLTVQPQNKPSGTRASRGAVRAALSRVLSHHTEGVVEQELGKAVSQYDPTVSARSIGAELRRMRNRLYRSESGKWFLIVREGKKETAGEIPAVPSTSTQEESDASETAIAA